MHWRRILGCVGFAACAPFFALAQMPDPVLDRDYTRVSVEAARLGQLLFYDPILSGNKGVACATCHHPAFGTGDGVSLPLGDGGVGLGPARRVDPLNPPKRRVPRNAPGMFNLGAQGFKALFHDGRVEAVNGKIVTPLGELLGGDYSSVLAAQAAFPVLDPDEMAGHGDENAVSAAVAAGKPALALELVARRVANVRAYGEGFETVFAGVSAPEDITFADIANALAAFIAFEWRSDTAPFDLWLRGQTELEKDALKGARLFYGAAGCSACHGGAFQTDHAYYVTGQMQIGPGTAGDGVDFGRFSVSGAPQDRFAFRVPSLRNVALTAPYGHAGAYGTLGAFLVAHSDGNLAKYDRTQPILPPLEGNDFPLLTSKDGLAPLIATRVPMGPTLRGEETAALLAFLHSLTDPAAQNGRLGIPSRVPSGLAVPR